MQIDFTKKTALYGGSFDPIHLGHIHVAKECQKLLGVEQVVFVPCAQSPGKFAPVASTVERLHMLQLALETLPFLIWEVELNRGGESYTIDTLREARNLRSDSAGEVPLYWIVGGDAYEGLPKWNRASDLRNYCKIVVVNRPQNQITLQSSEDIMLEIEPLPLSSTELRKKLALGEVPENTMPMEVFNYLRKLCLLGQNPYDKG